MVETRRNPITFYSLYPCVRSLLNLHAVLPSIGTVDAELLGGLSEFRDMSEFRETASRMSAARSASRKIFECSGCDTDGRSYESNREMWSDELERNDRDKEPFPLSSSSSSSPLLSPDDSKHGRELVWYKKSEAYWSHQEATVRGMLGGFEFVHDADIRGSRAFLDSLANRDGLSVATGKALDVGAGIGRVTRDLLLPRYNVVDMLEQNEAYLAESFHYIAMTSDRHPGKGVVHRRIPCGMHQFAPDEPVTGQSYRNRYNLIWVQWCIIYLTDDDLVKFIHVCFDCLVDGGVLCVKDNIAPRGPNGFVLDKSDSSVMRSDRYMKNLFARAGARVLTEQLQPHFPQNTYPVKTWALVSATHNTDSTRPITRSMNRAR